MAQPDLFGDEGIADLEEVARLAAQLPPWLHLGTSTWTYPGWRGVIYSRDYKKSETAQMLGEYARYPLFRTVCADSAFYRPLSARTLQSYAAVLPSHFPVAQKVWDRLTSFALGSPRNRTESREDNPAFLHPGIFQKEILDPCLEHFADHMGPIMFEFERFPAYTRMTAEEFAARLHQFFQHVPVGPKYAVEIRNAEFLTPVYFDALRAHNVAHVFNSWTHMPSIGEQMKHAGSMETANFVVCRALLKPGRTYVEAVQQFQPYDRIREPLPDVRQELIDFMDKARKVNLAYLFFNNRLEGSAPLTARWLAREFVSRG